MQKIFLIFSSLLIFLSSTESVLDLFSFNVSFAQTLSPTPPLKVNYELPYPGLLPNSPIYFLKIIRDKTVNFLISDPKKKAAFYLLQADKRLNAGIYLFNSAKQNEEQINLAISTISKAENYFQQALEKTKEARQEGMDVTEIIKKLLNSSKKHQEVLSSLEKRSSQNFKANFNSLQKRVRVFETEANSLGLKR